MAEATRRVGRCKPCYACMTPNKECGGKTTKFSNGIKNAPKTHGTPQEAQKCHIRYLLSQGYVKLGPRELWKEGEPILLLNKASKACRLRGGKIDRMMGRELTGGMIYSA